MKTVNNYVVKEKNVLIRVDLNVPVLNGIITEKSRIDIIKPTIKKLGISTLKDEFILAAKPLIRPIVIVPNK